jgi:hypothetical protein
LGIQLGRGWPWWLVIVIVEQVVVLTRVHWIDATARD